jgi:uncharacterized membrane protein
MTRQIEQFEMRRLEALSNTVFGVAMTLLAYDLPDADMFATAPTWTELYHAYAQKIIALMLSFIVAGIFWLSHHRRLALAPEGSRTIVILNLLFLMLIVLFPATNGLYGTYRFSSVIAVMYGLHLTLIATFNAFLWFLALRGREHQQAVLASAVFPPVVFMIGTTVALFAPAVSLYIWFLAFAAPLIGWVLGRRDVRPEANA